MTYLFNMRKPSLKPYQKLEIWNHYRRHGSSYSFYMEQYNITQGTVRRAIEHGKEISNLIKTM